MNLTYRGLVGALSRGGGDLQQEESVVVVVVLGHLHAGQGSFRLIEC